MLPIFSQDQTMKAGLMLSFPVYSPKTFNKRQLFSLPVQVCENTILAFNSGQDLTETRLLLSLRVDNPKIHENTSVAFSLGPSLCCFQIRSRAPKSTSAAFISGF